MKISLMTHDDLDAVERIQQHAYTDDLVEPLEVLASRLEIAPAFALVARDGADESAHENECIGYVLAHPWPADQSPGLNARLHRLPAGCDALHLHDMAVDPSCAGRGVGRALLTALLDAARDAGFCQITLVAVQGADTFWQKMGFHPVRPARGYDEGALLMQLMLHA